MEIMVSEAAKRTNLENMRTAASFFLLPVQHDSPEAVAYMAATRKSLFANGMAALGLKPPAPNAASASTKAATAEGARSVGARGEGALGSTRWNANTAAAATAITGRSMAPTAAVADADERDGSIVDEGLTTDDNRADNDAGGPPNSADRVQLARGRNATAAKRKLGQAQIDKAQAAIDLA
eukprot:TRINITY_DN8619_c0_g1_i1.p3 TRINITY_DN8619_c0_g1~~TRINITY_DN8619_c0_g1_i1.p3  ORF type:complete len:181 (-),score=24.18 TRINITY_DN8619_c0_g1_i1:432-974(-)